MDEGYYYARCIEFQADAIGICLFGEMTTTCLMDQIG